MKLSPMLTETEINNSTIKLALPQGESSKKSTKKSWQSLVARFWAHTEEMGKVDTKPFDGLL